MALPLDPNTQDGLFPDTLVEPFVRAPELEALADSVISDFDEFEPIQTAEGANLVLGIVGMEPIPPVSLSLRGAGGDFAEIDATPADTRPPKPPKPPADREMG